MNPCAATPKIEALEELTRYAIDEAAQLRGALARLHGATLDATAAELARRLCHTVAGIAIHAAGLAELAGVRFHVGRDRPRLDPCASLPGLSLPVALAALLDARAAGAADAELFTSLRNGGDA